MSYTLFASESVSEGHPDKIADQLSEAGLDAILAQDPTARVACKALVKAGWVVLGGEITTNAQVTLEPLVRQVIREIGYTKPELGFDADHPAILNVIGKQSPDRALGIAEIPAHPQGAGDQGTVFGYATQEIPVYMPTPLLYAHQLMQRQATLRKEGPLSCLRPEAKSQVTLRYEKGRPIGAHCVVFSTQHNPEMSLHTVREAVMETIIRPVLPAERLLSDTLYHINPRGGFVSGGPQSECGLTGRKTTIDTYGDFARQGSGAFSGKDPSQSDRSAAYMARYIAKNIVAAGLATQLEVQLSYAIGVAQPIAVAIETFGTHRLSPEKLLELIRCHFDLRPKEIIQSLKLQHPLYQKTAAYGHFGRAESSFTWERLDKVPLLQKAATPFLKDLS